MARKRTIWSWLTGCIFGFPKRLNDWWSRFDLRQHRIDETGWHRLGFLEHYSKVAFWLPALVLLFLIYGLPRLASPAFLVQRGWPLFWAFVVAMVIHVAICFKAKDRWLPRLQFLLLAAFALGVFYRADPLARHVDASAYPHIYAWLGVVVLALAMPINRWAAERWLLGWVGIEEERRELREKFADELGRTQLFVKHVPPARRWSRLLRGFSLVPLTSPVLLTILPAAWAIVSVREWLWIGVVAGLLFSWAVLASAHYQERLSAFLEIARQLVVRGAPGAVSAIVLLLAALRLVGVDYVTTVLDQRSRWVLAGLIVMLYLLFWLYEYWSQRALSEVLLGLLHKPTTAGAGEPAETRYPAVIAYPKRGVTPATRADGVLERRLQIHGNGRLIAIEETDRTRDPENFQAHPALDVFRRILNQVEARARSGGSWSQVNDLGDAVKALEQRARLYRIVSALIIAAVVGAYGYRIYTQEQSPAIEARNLEDTTGLFRLDTAIRALENEPEVYAVAASGGGTRAALYTYSLLKALREHEVLDRVVMVSGVSGGSLGLAYYLAHRDELLRESPIDQTLEDEQAEGGERENNTWRCYREATTSSYIAQVLAGAGEYRFLKGGRLGLLLTESFDRQLFPENVGQGGCKADPKRTFGAQTDVGFVFNSSVSGAWHSRDPIAEACVSEGRPTLVGWRDSLARECGSVMTRGSRLALTNIRSFDAAGLDSRYPDWDLDFDYAVVNDPKVTFAQAASVSANFPPVFSNAMLRLETVEEEGRYWITDGGAVENRGAISILLALRAELRAARRADEETREEPEEGVATADGVESCTSPPGTRGSEDAPWIKVLVAEASGGAEGYAEDRGTGTALRASKEVADKLIPELARQVDREYCEWTKGRGRVKVVYLPMPATLSRAFGTHWQLLRSTEATDPRTWYRTGPSPVKPWTWFARDWGPSPASWFHGKPPTVALSGEEIKAVMDHLFASESDRRGIPFEDPNAHEHLWDWIAVGADGGSEGDPSLRLQRELDL